MKLDIAVFACMNDDELARVGDQFLEQIIADGMTEAAMPNLALLLDRMSLAAAKRCSLRPPDRPRLVTRKADNVLHVNFVSLGSRPVARDRPSSTPVQSPPHPTMRTIDTDDAQP